MKTYIIAEAGVNHNGDMDTAKRLVDAAIDAGADAVKFQMFKAEKLASSAAEMAQYQKQNTGVVESQQDMLRKLELSAQGHIELQEYCKGKNIEFLSSPFDTDSMKFLISIGMDTIKIPSGEIVNFPYLREAAQSGKKIILSTGMSTLEEVREAFDVIKKYSDPSENIANRLILMHCNTQYPTPYEYVNLNAMQTMRKEFGFEVGYSDHTPGIEVAIAAVAMGATVIEKHFTLDKNMPGPDHKASLEPDELKAMVASIRHIEAALGDGIKRPTESEKNNIAIVRKSIIAAKDIKKGELFTEDNLTTKRPGDGISPMRWNDIIGTKADRDYKEDELIRQ